MSDLTLFDLGAVGLVPEPASPKLSPDRRRTLRQARMLAAGLHPLGPAAGRRLHLHAGAAPVDDRSAPGRRCGNCRWRQLLSGEHAGKFPKCCHPGRLSADEYERLGPPRASQSAATDCRAWWPGCTDHEYGDQALGLDAARWVPSDSTTGE